MSNDTGNSVVTKKIPGKFKNINISCWIVRDKPVHF